MTRLKPLSVAAEKLDFPLLEHYHEFKFWENNVMKLLKKQRKSLACFLVCSFICFVNATTFSVLAQEQTPDSQALKLIEESEGLYQQESFEDALTKLTEAAGLAQGKEIKALASLEMAYVKFLQGKRLLIFRYHIEEALKLNPEINVQEGNYKPGFLEAFQSVKSETLMMEKPETKGKVVEKPESEKPKVKKRHFPWLGVILGLAVAGGLVYYFVIMKNTLQVDTSPAGAKVYLDGSDTGKVSPCQLEPSTGSHTIKVELEGYTDVERQVEIKKGKNSVNITLTAATYTMTAPAAGANVQREAPCLINWDSSAIAAFVSSPASNVALGVTAVDLELYQGDTKLNDIARGVPNSGTYSWNVPATTSEGSNHRILISCPSVPESRAFGPTFNLLGFKEDFSDNAANFWLPDNAASWKVAGGYYTASKKTERLGLSIYNFSYSGSSYTVESKMRWSEFIGDSGGPPLFIMLGTSNSFTNNSGYVLGYDMKGSIGIYMVNHYNFLNPPPGPPTILYSGSSSAVNKGLNKWNTVKVVREGTSYKLYINDTLIHTFTHSTYDPKYVMIGFGTDMGKTTCDFDYVHMTINQ